MLVYRFWNPDGTYYDRKFKTSEEQQKFAKELRENGENFTVEFLREERDEEER